MRYRAIVAPKPYKTRIAFEVDDPSSVEDAARTAALEQLAEDIEWEITGIEQVADEA